MNPGEGSGMAQILNNDQFLMATMPETNLAIVPVRYKPLWQDVTPVVTVPDDDLLVTHINQTADLLRMQGPKVHAGETQTSEEWLSTHSLEYMKLTIAHLLTQGRLITTKSHFKRKHLEFSATSINEFESQLYEAVELYHRRIGWLMQGSRKIFGLVKGTKVGVLVDASNANCSLGKLYDFQQCLLGLIDEQLCYKKQLYFSSFGTEESSLWSTPRDINVRTLHEARMWIQALEPSGGCNLLHALKKMLLVRDLNSLVVILGGSPDQSTHVLFDYIEQCMVGRKALSVHMVAFDCSSSVTEHVVKKLAEVMGGRFHCNVSLSQMCKVGRRSPAMLGDKDADPNYYSCDIHHLQSELQRSEEVLRTIKEMRQGLLGDTLISIMQEISEEVAKLPSAHFLPKPPMHDRPLSIEMPNFLPKTSADWLKTNGLKAKKLSLYQILAPNAFSPIEDFVPILRKTVSSTLHEKAMMQFEWHDGTVKNVHVDPPLLYNYQKQLTKAVKMYEKRIDWLTTGSRQIWGTVGEKRVLILIDTSLTNAMYIIHIQHSLRLLLEQQMTNKECFNIMAFGKGIKALSNEMVTPTPDNLQDAWKWVLDLECEGSRNLMNALKYVMEVDALEDAPECQGIYLFTSGVPDQEEAVLCSYVAELCAGRDLRIHICLFSINTLDMIPARFATPRETAVVYRDLANSSKGRFHWFNETGIIDSDDINIIMSEIEKAVNFSQKCALLVDSLKQRSGHKQLEGGSDTLSSRGDKQAVARLPGPKPTALTLARMQPKEESAEETNSPFKALTWRPNSTKATTASASSMKSSGSSEKDNKQRKSQKVSQCVFYTEEGNRVGCVFKKYPKAKSVRKSIPFAALPKEEDVCSTKQWLQRFSLKRLKLDLHKLVSGPDCTHQKKLVPAVNKKVAAKYCTIFPSIEVNGVVKHLQFQPQELEAYIEQLERVIRRYAQRMQWLLSGSRRLFGTVLEKKVCILLDTSGSMDIYLPEVKKELTSLIWEQLQKNCTSFNLLSFSDKVHMWKHTLQEATDEACHDAVQWVSEVKAHGSTCTLEALQAAFQLADVQAFYLLTDGKPDTSCQLVLKEVEQMTQRKQITIHTTSFNCSDSTANNFLKRLASQTGGRYHRCTGDVDGHLVAHRILTEGLTNEDDPILPAFEGDDLQRLADEIGRARRFLTQARAFRELLLEKQQKSDSQNSTSVSSQVSEKPNSLSSRRI
ncbi:von Willebrand factor A domain-containing protein 3A isoform X1 [Polypterus senegalus]|uniref:von Willebrand factor A domain-containing protein 3A isoform X1 n=2 Tax=Polypterus senegalus TaxID=55291 RepID=UPI001964068D|nr:von Willebrand factor A domain-containing protein 3A isoform X1 [Polypterus senegalus]